VTSFTPAATLPLHPTALGRAVLAFAPPHAVESIILRGFHPYTTRTITSPDRFRRALAVTRLTKVALTRGELEPGIGGVAMPVFGPGGDVVASIELTIAELDHRSTDDRKPEPVPGDRRRRPPQLTENPPPARAGEISWKLSQVCMAACTANLLGSQPCTGTGGVQNPR